MAVSPPVCAFIVERLALLLQRGLERVQGEMDPAIIGGIFSLGEQAILFHSRARLGDILRLLVGDALAAFVILFAVFRVSTSRAGYPEHRTCVPGHRSRG